MLRVSVIIPHYNDPEGLARCLDALDRQSFDQRDMEIVVADNASPCGIEAVERVVAGRGRVVLQPEKGAGAARNAAVAASSAPNLAFVDSDCLPESGWLAAGLDCLGKGAELVGGAMTVSVADENHITPVEAFERVFAFDNRSYVETKGFSVTANLFTTRAVFDAVGGFRAHVSEDADWCYRARDLGFRIAYCEGAVVAHPARKDWGELIRKWQRLTSESLALHRAGGGTAMAWLARSWLLPLSVLAHLPRVLLAPQLPGVAEKRGAAGVLLRLRMWRFFANHRALWQGNR